MKHKCAIGEARASIDIDECVVYPIEQNVKKKAKKNKRQDRKTNVLQSVISQIG
jgi:hypothetical protein